jgi:Trk-type K+ transport system membrane component
MDLINNLDGRIFEFSLSTLFDTSHLFDPRPQTFYFVSWAILLGVLGIVLSLVLLWWFKKRRDRFYVGKGGRRIYSRHSKIALIVWVVYLVFVLLRTQAFAYLSMPFWLYLLVLIQIVNTVYAIVKVKRSDVAVKEEKAVEIETSTQDYAKYLPKKKKK